MAATIKIKNSSTAGAAPTSSDLVQGELAVNVTDKRLYTENSSGTIVELGTNPSVPVTFPDGSASAPSLTNDGDTNTGLFFPAADTVGITTGGTERARVDSSGNLGLGVTPSAWSLGKAFEIGSLGNSVWAPGSNNLRLATNYVYNAADKYVATGRAAMYEQGSGQHIWYNSASGSAGGTVTFTQAMTLDANGTLSLSRGSSIVAVFGDASNATDKYIRIGNSSGNFEIGSASSGHYLYGNGTLPLQFYTNATERARIDSSGRLLVGTTSALNSTANLSVFNTSGGSSGGLSIGYGSGAAANRWIYLISANGSLYFESSANAASLNSAGAWTNASDARLKNSITDIKYGLSAVLSSQPRSYKMNDLEGDYIGFVAQELQNVIPEVVSGDPEKQLGVDYGSLVAVAFKAIQEQQAIITQLQADVAALKG